MSGPKPFWDWAACGTSKQYKKHLRWKIPPCESCKRAEYRRVADGIRTREMRHLRALYRDYRVRTVRRGGTPRPFREWRLNHEVKVA